MKYSILFVIICILGISCSRDYEDSKIEIIKIDRDLVKEIQSDYDSTYQETPKRNDFWTINYYLKDTVETRIFLDSTENIVGISKFINGLIIFANEYYPNGQLIGKTEFPPGKIDGNATYYYSDGRIKSVGLWKDYKQVGEWRNYKPSGKLESIEFYDDNGELKKEEIIKN